MLVDNFDLDASYNGGWFGLLLGAGAINVGVGADLQIAANQASQNYW